MKYTKKQLLSKRWQKKYARFLENKKVVIVSAAPHILEEEEGYLIDSYDIVVRINQGHNIPIKIRKNIGSRVDMLYCSFKKDARFCLYKKPTKWVKKIKWVCSTRPKLFGRVSMWDKEINQGQTKIHLNGYNDIDILSSKIGLNIKKHIPTTGFLAIFDLLKYNIKELYVTGFTFYKFVPGSSGDFYYSKYQDPIRGPGRDGITKHGKIKTMPKKHPIDLEFEYFKKLCKKDKKIKCDKVLSELLEVY